jgi:hypothetical protein
MGPSRSFVEGINKALNFNNQQRRKPMKAHPIVVGFAWLFSALIVGTAAAADGPDSDSKATGSVGLSSPLQFADFNVSENGKGRVTYTNFEFPVPGTGVWAPAQTTTIAFNYQGPDYHHIFSLDSFTPLSTESVGFTGTGYFDPDHSYTWNLKGMINEDAVWFQILYTGTSAGCKLYAHGTISDTGVMSGTWGGNCWSGNNNSWSTGPGAAYEVFSYKARTTCASIDELNADATFGFTIPNGVPLAGVPIVVKVHDGGSPGALHDTWWHGVDSAPGSCTPGAGWFYPITSGNLVVHPENDRGRRGEHDRDHLRDDRNDHRRD